MLCGCQSTGGQQKRHPQDPSGANVHQKVLRVFAQLRLIRIHLILNRILVRPPWFSVFETLPESSLKLRVFASLGSARAEDGAGKQLRTLGFPESHVNPVVSC